MNKSLTLLELIISIAIISLIVLGFTSLDLYSRHNVLLASRRARVQNALSYVLDHMTKNVSQAIGDSSSETVNTDDIDDNTAFKVRIDSDGTKGELDASDIQIAYAYNDTSHQIWYYSDYTNDPISYEVIAENILPDFSGGCSSPTKDSCVRYDNTTNYIQVRLAGRWDATQEASQDNPEDTMLTRIKMWGVSTASE